MHPNPGKERRDTWWDASQARFHLCLRQGAGRQFAWLEVGSVKVASSRPAHQPPSGCYGDGYPINPDTEQPGQDALGQAANR